MWPPVQGEIVLFIFLCVADTHGYLPDEQLNVDCQPDALLLLGDLQYSIKNVLRCFPDVPAFGVAGNHDLEEPFAGLPVVNLHGRAVFWNGIKLAGLGGCLRYKPCSFPWLFWEHEYEKLLTKMPRADLIISHCAPFGCWQEPPLGGDRIYHDAHEGSRSLRDHIVNTRPELVIHGHLHQRDLSAIGDTLVRAVYGVEIVKFTPG